MNTKFPRPSTPRDTFSPAKKLLPALVCCALLSACGSSDDPATDTDGDDNTVTPPSGLLDTAQPLFSWPAVSNAEQYKIVVTDAGGSGYERTLDPIAASCQTGEGTCTANTNMAYYDNDLSWYVESTVDGAPGARSQTFTMTTPCQRHYHPVVVLRLARPVRRR